MASSVVLTEFGKIFPELNLALGIGIPIFARMAGFFRFAPVFSRKEVPSMIRVSLALISTVIIALYMRPKGMPSDVSLIYCIFLNFVFGSLIGFIANAIMEAIAAGGDMINSQMGLSSATVLDPATQQQTSLLGNYFGLLAVIIFISAGGVYWLFDAFIRSFDVFPMFASTLNINSIINIEYVSQITANVLFMGMQIAAPVLLATLGQDIILGIISKTAPQVNVFQLSFLFKPVLGAAILSWILPMIVSAINDYLVSYSDIF